MLAGSGVEFRMRFAGAGSGLPVNVLDVIADHILTQRIELDSSALKQRVIMPVYESKNFIFTKKLELLGKAFGNVSVA